MNRLPWLVLACVAAAGLALLPAPRAVRADDDPPAAPGMDGEPGMDAEPGMDGAPAPEGAVKSLRFEKLGLTWNLVTDVKVPAGKSADGEPLPPKTASIGLGTKNNLDADKSNTEEIAQVGLQIDGETVGFFLLATQPEKEGATASGFVRNDDNFREPAKLFEGAAVPQIDDTVDIGNWRGAMRGMTGKSKENGKPLMIKQWFAVLHGVIWHISAVAHDGAERTYHEWFKGMIAGFKWDDASEGVRGPFVAPFPSFTGERKNSIDAGKKAPFSHSALNLTKSEKWARIKFSAGDQGFEPWVFAAEARDTDAYAFVGIQKFPLPAFVQQKKEPDTLIDDHENEWRNALDDPVTRTGKDKNKKPDSFKGAKGWSYEFKGTKDGVPYVERGWVVKQSQLVLLIRIQLGGTAAEAKLKAEADKLVGSVKFN